MSVNQTSSASGEAEYRSPVPGVSPVPTDAVEFVEDVVAEIDGVEYAQLSADLTPLVSISGNVARVRADLEEARLETARCRDPVLRHDVQRQSREDIAVFRVSSILPA